MTKSQRELEQIQGNLEYSNKELKVFIADLLPYGEITEEEIKDKITETENLVNTFGGIVILKHIQKKSMPDYETFIGEGRLDEIVEEMKEAGANILIIGSALKTAQIYNINERLRSIGAKCWDRIDLILKIFEKHAGSAEAKLQIELASIKHMGPRIFGMGMELSKQGGGIGTRGKGETNTEIMKRHLAKKEIAIKKELDKFKKVRAEHRKSRKRKGLHTIGIVGYTNAGKSSLLNALTTKGVLAEDKLFATLGTSVSKMWIEASYDEENNFEYKPGIEILLNDTIGFIRDLPPNLIQAFSSTLEDSIESELLFHVIDASDKKLNDKIEVVNKILKEIGANQKKIYIFNKIDLLNNMELDNLKKQFEKTDSLYVSSNKKLGFDKLKKYITKFFLKL
ncbi:GTPase HflX [Candidatus Gracilibacteria bacterium]|nr:MAG: GTPase HflX [Candidatus Gracilibacteria bacterium]